MRKPLWLFLPPHFLFYIPGFKNRLLYEALRLDTNVSMVICIVETALRLLIPEGYEVISILDGPWRHRPFALISLFSLLMMVLLERTLYLNS